MSHAIPTSLRRSRVEWLVAAVSLVLLGIVLAAALYRERGLVGARESDRLQVHARVVDDNLIRQLEGANNALAGLRDEFEQARPGADVASVSRRLKQLSEAMPGVRTMAIVDARGVIVASSRAELLGTNSSRRDFFTTPRARPDRSVLYVARPFKSPLGPFVVSLGRVLTDAQGAFAGVVLATLDPEYFAVVLRSVRYAPDMRAFIVHGDGEVFVNTPVVDEAIGMDLAQPDSMFARHQQSGLTATLMTGRLLATGDDRMVAMRTLARAELHMDKPMVAAVGRELSAIYLPWRDEALKSGIVYVLFVSGSCLALHFRQRRRLVLDRLEEQAEAARQHGAERVELALRGADLGLWDLQVPSNHLAVNARERELLGYTGDGEWPTHDWRQLIHPEDWPALDAALRPHLRGETEAYECEHRLQHHDGHWIWVFCRGMVVERDAAGAPQRIVGTHLDITERRRTDAELARTLVKLQRSEEQLRQLTDNLPALVSRLDLTQRFRFANGAYRDWLGIDPASLLGRTVLEVYGEQTYACIRHHLDAAFAGERVVYEREFATPQGARHVEVTLIPERAADGSVRGLYGLINDLTARHETELQRARSEERLSLALEGSGLALFDWDIGGDSIYQSAQAAVMRGDPALEETVSSAALRSHVHPDDLDAMRAGMAAAMTGAAPLYHAEFRVRRRSGEWLWLRARGRVVERDGRGWALRMAGTYADITAHKVAEERLRHRAEFDTLTDLPNRALFVERLRQAMQRATAMSTMALLFLDVDHFKTINDTLGHEAGDQLLKVFAARMRDGVRQSDTVARLAGDEFTIILEGLRGPEDANALASKLVEMLRAPMALAGKIFVITSSVGIAMWREGEGDDADILRRADAALYEAKRLGRDRCFCEDADAMAGPPVREFIAASDEGTIRCAGRQDSAALSS